MEGDAMDNPWKMTTIGIALVLVTALTTGLATAYFTSAPKTPVHSSTRIVYAAPERAAARYADASPAVGCDRDAKFGRLAKDGVIGGVVGAALGAGTGAIADGGRAAGKGAGIGGLTGAVAGGLYGAYQNKGACGNAW
jgi:hypothetical protein